MLKRDADEQALRTAVSMRHLNEESRSTRAAPLASTIIACNDNASQPATLAGCRPLARSSVFVTSSGTQRSDSDDSSGVSSLESKMSAAAATAIAAGAAHSRLLHRADALLERIERLRAALAPIRGAELPELAAFEAAMLQWEAFLKARRPIVAQLESSASLLQLNRAILVEHSRSIRQRNASGGGVGRNALRASLYAQNSSSPSPEHQ